MLVQFKNVKRQTSEEGCKHEKERKMSKMKLDKYDEWRRKRPDCRKEGRKRGWSGSFVMAEVGVQVVKVKVKFKSLSMP